MKMFQSKLNITEKGQGGFTLIEMTVASSMFITAVVIIMGALVSLESASRKVRATRIAMDNIGAAIDSMSRTMRMGSTFNCGCENPSQDPRPCMMTLAPNDIDYGTCVAFEHQSGDINNPNDQFWYRHGVHANGNGQIERSKANGIVGSWETMTAPEINITDLKFWIGGVSASTEQPYITMVIRGTASTGPKISSSFNIQTTVSQRVPNIDLTP